MSNIRRIQFLAIILVVFLAFGITGCKTTPEPEPEEKPVIVEEPVKKEEPKVEPEPKAEPEESETKVLPAKPRPKPKKEAPKVTSLSQSDIKAARDAVQQAQKAGANTYFPKEYRALTSSLNRAISMGKSSPDKARVALKKVISDAQALQKKAFAARMKQYSELFARNDAALKSIEAPRFAAADYKKTHDMNREVLSLFNKGNVSRGQSMANDTLELQKRIHYNLSENIRYVNILKRDTENYLQDAEDNEAFTYSPQELNAANSAYQKGVSALRNYHLEASAQALTEAKRQAILAARTSAVRKKQAETDSLMAATQKRIESASGLRVLNERGEVVESRPWSGDDYLAQNPLIDHSKNVGDVEVDNPELKKLNAPVTGSRSGKAQDIPIGEDGTQVKADEQESDYLLFAKNFWEKGVQARNGGQFELAQEYFRKAQAYIDAYESNAVSRTYTVVRRKVATDCLWRISERNDIFANPFLWPKIWRANRRIIQNPDLIYPGQVLVIPPK